ncbi:MAG: FliH/SctL family protein [Magnetococcus sp. YQC-3]
MAGVLDGIIKQEDLDDVPQRVSFRDLVDDSNRARGEKFVRFLPGGRLPEVPGAKDPKIDEEELRQRRLETIERETYQRAFAAGEEAGLALGEQTMEQEMARLLPQFETVLRQLDGLPRRVFAGAERFLVETAIMMTRELLAHELTVDPEEVLHRVRRMLEQAAGRREIVIRLAPDQAVLLQSLSGFEKLRIEADPDIAPGSVRMDSDFGGIEDNLERQLAEMEAGLRGYLQDRLRAAGCEEMAAEARQYAEQAAMRGRPLLPASPVKSSPPGERPSPHSFSPQDEPDRPAPRPVGISAIAEALAAADEQEEWPGHGGGQHPFAEEEEDDAPMEPTVVSTATARMNAGSSWEYEDDATAVSASADGVLPGEQWASQWSAPGEEQPFDEGLPGDEEPMYAADPQADEEPMYAADPQADEEPMYAADPQADEEPVYDAAPPGDEEPVYDADPQADEEPMYAAVAFADEEPPADPGGLPEEGRLPDGEPMPDHDENA